MTRYKLTLEYDGTDFVGWQRQNNGPSIQEELERAVHGFCGETVTAFGAGRAAAGAGLACSLRARCGRHACGRANAGGAA